MLFVFKYIKLMKNSMLKLEIYKDYYNLKLD